LRIGGAGEMYWIAKARRRRREKKSKKAEKVRLEILA